MSLNSSVTSHGLGSRNDDGAHPSAGCRRVTGSWEEVRERIRMANAIETVVDDHTDLRRSGNRLIGCCPFTDHEDGEPSFTVFRNESFFCFGCRRGGDVFAFVQHLRGVDFLGSLRLLAERAGIKVDGLRPDEGAQRSSQRLTRVVSAAAARLSSQHLEYLRRRGLTDETIARLQVGSLDADTLLLPVLRRGIPVYPIRHLPHGTPRYRFPRRESHGPKPIVGLEVLGPQATVYAVEGFFDYAAMVQAGFDAVGLLGLGTRGQVEQLAGAKAIRLLMDGDESGRGAAVCLARDLYPCASIVNLPSGRDPASLAVELGEGFASEVERLTAEADDALGFALADANDDPTGETISSDVVSLLTRLNGIALDVAVERVHAVSKQLGIRKETLRQEIDRSRAASDSGAEDTRADAEQPKLEPVIDREAEELLRKANLLGAVVRDTTTLGLRGEEIVRQLLLLVAVAGHTAKSHEEAIHAVVKGDSSTGKNELVRGVIGLLPKGRVRFLTGVSQQALVYSGGRIEGVLVFQEAEGEEHAEYAIRQAMSEGHLERITVEDGETKVLRTYVAGSIVTTTTSVALHEENQTRVFDIHTDESPALTRQVIAAAAEQAAGTAPPKAVRDRVRTIWRAALGKLEPSAVTIPFAPVIAEQFPDRKPRARRDVKRTFNLIRACAVLHQRSRQRDEEGRLVATPEDYRMVYPIVQAVLGPSMSGLTEKAMLIAALHGELADDADKGWVSRAELQKEAHIRSVACEKTVRDWAFRFDRMGFWEGRKKDGRWQYRSLRDVSEEPVDLPTPDQLVDLVSGGSEALLGGSAHTTADSGSPGSPGTEGPRPVNGGSLPAEDTADATGATKPLDLQPTAANQPGNGEIPPGTVTDGAPGYVSGSSARQFERGAL